MSMDHIEAIINQSKKDGSNIAVRYDGKDQVGWNYYDFENLLKPYFVKCDEATIRKNVQFDPYQSLDIIPLKPLSSKRQAQLFKDIRPYVHDPYKDELCFAPNEHDISLSNTEH
ncbi:13774_t:CDS:2 [Funneliformis mosseae]|uniref:13774_t:CDS:1 n=1 Tax=Funneliformis mosseae TaxID=27381 RepID=A0A9N8V4K1_FUNMO|nr:13774_t:CDS:2 [Funneliformis mosseae]